MNLIQMQHQYNELSKWAYESSKSITDLTSQGIQTLRRIRELVADTTIKFGIYKALEEGSIDQIKARYFSLFDKYSEVANYTSYSKFNHIFAIKRYCSTVYALNKQLSNVKRGVKLNLLWDNVLEFEKELQKKAIHSKISKMLDDLYDLKVLLHNCKTINFESEDYINMVDMLFVGGNTITKNEFLQIVNVSRDLNLWDGSRNNTPEIVNSLPEIVDQDTFWRAIFSNKIEDDAQDYFLNMMLTRMLNLRESNKEFKNKLDDKMNEMFTGIPRHSVQTDEFGEVVSIEHAKPKLRLVK